MLLTYKECLEKFGSDYMIKKALASEKLFQIEKGIYSDTQRVSERDFITKKYPRGIYTSESAYYYYGLTDSIPELHHIATRRSDSRIKDVNIRQYFVNDELFLLGKTILSYNGTEINIYDRERLLIDLIRFGVQMPFDYYKELINSYRQIVHELDYYKIESYAANFKNGERILQSIQKEVL